MDANSTNSSDSQQLICPYLGMQDDMESHMAFTSPLNYCHRSRSPAPVKPDHQESYCLDTNFPACPVYEHGAGKSFPRELRARGKVQPDYVYGSRKKSWPVFLFVIGAILLGIGYFWWDQWNLIIPIVSSPTPFQFTLASNTPVPVTEAPTLPATPTVDPLLPTLDPSHPPTVTPFPTLTLTPTLTPTVTRTPTTTLTPTITRTPTFTPSLTYTASAIPTTSPHSLDIPLGKVQKYLIHRVQGGENLTGLADQYQTSIEAITAVNPNLATPVWNDALVILPVNMKNPVGLPVLEAYQVLEDQITVEELASKLQADPGLLKYFNDCADGEKLNVGDWMLIPR